MKKKHRILINWKILLQEAINFCGKILVIIFYDKKVKEKYKCDIKKIHTFFSKCLEYKVQEIEINEEVGLSVEDQIKTELNSSKKDKEKQELEKQNMQYKSIILFNLLSSLNNVAENFKRHFNYLDKSRFPPIILFKVPYSDTSLSKNSLYLIYT